MDVDRLAEIRHEMKVLRAEAKLIRLRLLGEQEPLVGAHYVGVIRHQIVLREVSNASVKLTARHYSGD